jgi:predicted nucleic acid-binding protein
MPLSEFLAFPPDSLQAGVIMAGRDGMKLPVIDALIAASAQVHHLTVATRNVIDVERRGAGVFNPWA